MQKEYKIYSSRLFEKQLNKVPQIIREMMEAWARSVKLNGLDEIRKISGYHDEPLQGQRFGQRSVRLTRSYRLIYREEKRENVILLLEVTKHDY